MYHSSKESSPSGKFVTRSPKSARLRSRTAGAKASGWDADAMAASTALAQSGADGVMVGRAALGRPWLPGQIARALRTGLPQPAPTLPEQHALLRELYEELLRHHGLAVGIRHARKHLRAAVEAAFGTAEGLAPAARTALHTLLTADEPAAVLRAMDVVFGGATSKAAA